MTKEYSYEEIEEIIGQAWQKAVEHLINNLGDKYQRWETDDAAPKFYDKVLQDITFTEEDDFEEDEE